MKLRRNGACAPVHGLPSLARLLCKQDYLAQLGTDKRWNRPQAQASGSHRRSRIALRFLGFALSLVLGATTASAAPVTFKSGDGLNEYNSVTGTNVVVLYNPHWAVDSAGGAWVSHIETGYGQNFLPNSATVPFARFTEEFILPPSAHPYVGTIYVWGDDTARVFLNGQLLQPENLVLGAHCTGAPIGCLTGLGTGLYVVSPPLQIGLNKLEIDAFQLGGDSAGVLYSGSIAHSPEPATFALLGIGLAGFAGLRLRRRR